MYDLVFVVYTLTSNDVFVFLFSVDQSSDQLSEDPGFALIYVCAAVLFGVNVKLSFPSCEHTSAVFS